MFIILVAIHPLFFCNSVFLLCYTFLHPTVPSSTCISYVLLSSPLAVMPPWSWTLVCEEPDMGWDLNVSPHDWAANNLNLRDISPAPGNLPTVVLNLFSYDGMCFLIALFHGFHKGVKTIFIELWLYSKLRALDLTLTYIIQYLVFLCFIISSQLYYTHILFLIL